MSEPDEPEGDEALPLGDVTIGPPDFGGDDELDILDGDGDDGELEVVWDLTDYEPEALDLLDAALERAGIPKEWEQDSVLVVPESHATQAELLIERLDHPMALAPQPDGPEGDEAERMLGTLWDVATWLQREPTDARGLEGLVRAGEAAALAPTPYGVDPAAWGETVRLVEELRTEALADRPDIEAVRQLAGDLLAAVRPMV
jgi:hypothetical protein